MHRQLRRHTWLRVMALGVMALGIACSTTGCTSLVDRGPGLSDVSTLGPDGAGSARSFETERVSFEQEESEEGVELQDFAPRNLSKTLARMSGYGPATEREAQETFTRAEARYGEAAKLEGEARRAAFREAAELFEKAARQRPDSAIEHDSLYMLGASNFFADRYVDANRAYEMLLKKYPNSKMLDAAEAHRYAIAQYWLNLHQEDPRSFWEFNFLDEARPWRDERGNAVRIFDKIRIDDPMGKLADDATMALANAQFRATRYVSAAATYSDLIATFPNSRHQFDAHLLAIKAKLLSYQGSDYSGDVLDEAEKLIRQARAQFPDRADQERPYLDRAYAEVRYKQAEREWAMARYYDRRQEYRAARGYYGIVVDQYADTPFAEKAEDRIGRLTGQPDVPPQRLGWLVDLFPEEETVKPLIATKPKSSSLR